MALRIVKLLGCVVTWSILDKAPNLSLARSCMCINLLERLAKKPPGFGSPRIFLRGTSSPFWVGLMRRKMESVEILARVSRVSGTGGGLRGSGEILDEKDDRKGRGCWDGGDDR